MTLATNEYFGRKRTPENGGMADSVSAKLRCIVLWFPRASAEALRPGPDVSENTRSEAGRVPFQCALRSRFGWRNVLRARFVTKAPSSIVETMVGLSKRASAALTSMTATVATMGLCNAIEVAILQR